MGNVWFKRRHTHRSARVRDVVNSATGQGVEYSRTQKRDVLGSVLEEMQVYRPVEKEKKPARRVSRM